MSSSATSRTSSGRREPHASNGPARRLPCEGRDFPSVHDFVQRAPGMRDGRKGCGDSSAGPAAARTFCRRAQWDGSQILRKAWVFSIRFTLQLAAEGGGVESMRPQRRREQIQGQGESREMPCQSGVTQRRHARRLECPSGYCYRSHGRKVSPTEWPARQEWPLASTPSFAT